MVVEGVIDPSPNGVPYSCAAQLRTWDIPDPVTRVNESVYKLSFILDGIFCIFYFGINLNVIILCPGGSSSFVTYHPYIYGFQATKVPLANSDTLRCGTIREVKISFEVLYQFKV